MSEFITAFIGVSFSVIISGSLLGGSQLMEYLVLHPRLMIAHDLVFWSSYVGMFLLPYSLIRKATEQLSPLDRVALAVISGATIALLIGLLFMKVRETQLRKDVLLKTRLQAREAETLVPYSSEALRRALMSILEQASR